MPSILEISDVLSVISFWILPSKVEHALSRSTIS